MELLKIKLLKLLLNNIFKYNKKDCREKWLETTIDDMINIGGPVIADIRVEKEENCFPMIPSGKPHNQMILGPNEQEKNKIKGKGKALV